MDTENPDHTMLKAFLLISVLTIFGVGVIAPSMAEQRERQKAQLIGQWMDDVQRLAKAEPGRFASYRMDSLQCTLSRMSFTADRNGNIKNPVQCQVEDSQGRSVDFSREVVKVIVETRLLLREPVTSSSRPHSKNKTE